MDRTERNKYGVLVNKACISCKYCKARGNKRCCNNPNAHLYAQDVNRGHLCELWKMKLGLQQAGKGGGRIKKIAYLREVLKGEEDAKTIKARFEREGISIYLSK